jgi:hypothetical protein
LFIGTVQKIGRIKAMKKGLNIKYTYPLIGVFMVTVLLVWSIAGIMRNNPDAVALCLHENLRQIALAFQKIDTDCSIVEIDGSCHEINFLTQGEPQGNELGCLTLAYPDQYKGPYLQKDVCYQKKLYEMICADDGFFIVPGKGSRLPNGYVMGKDIVITQQTKMKKLLKEGAPLRYKGIALAIPLLEKVPQSPIHGLDSVPKSPFLKEFNEVMPFVQYMNPTTHKIAYIKNQC